MGGWGHLSPVPRLWGWNVCPPPPSPSTPFLLPLLIPCSLVVAKLLCNSCASTLPRPDSDKLKKKKPRLLPCWAFVIGLGVNEKVQNTGETVPIFLGNVLFLFSIFFLSFKPPSRSHGLCCFSEHLAYSDLHCNCCAPSPTWEPYQSTKRTTRKFKSNC